MKEIIRIDGRCWCPQCGHYYDYKEMADENICQECVHQTREFQKVDFKRLLESMPEEDIDEEFNKYYGKRYDDDEITEEEKERIELRKEIKREIDDWFYNTEDRDLTNLFDRIIKLI